MHVLFRPVRSLTPVEPHRRISDSLLGIGVGYILAVLEAD